MEPERPVTLTPASVVDALEHGRPIWHDPPRHLGFTVPVSGAMRLPTGPGPKEPRPGYGGRRHRD